MLALRSFFSTQPLLATIASATVGIGGMSLVREYWQFELFAMDIVTTSMRLIISLLVLVLICKLDWAVKANIVFRRDDRGRAWPLACIPLLLIGAINLSLQDWSKLSFSVESSAAWMVDNLAIGLYEETLLRGLCLTILYQGWKHKNNALIKAAIAQALLFGFFHVFNIRSMPLVDVSAQVVYASLLGIAFAGLVVYTRSIFLAAFIHGFIDATGTLGNFFDPNFVQVSNSAEGYIAGIIFIFVICTLPGFWMLKRGQASFGVTTPQP